MEKITLGRPGKILTLDHCARCGGIWFEKGETQRLTWHSPSELWKLVPPRSHIIRPPCHGCGAPLDRDHQVCFVCSRANEIACPTCDRKTVRVQTDGLTLDVCENCKGVWFDHAELRSIWKLKLNEIARRGRSNDQPVLADGGSLLLESFVWAPDLTLYTADAVVSGVSHVAGALGHVAASGGAEAAAGALHIVGAAAESLFDAIAEILGGLFN